MSDPALTAETAVPERQKRSAIEVIRSAEVDSRLLGMVLSLAVIWIAFHVLSDGKFITSRNLWNLSVQSTSIAIMATGMVLIIVTRNIDLSVGSLLGFLGYTMVLVQTHGTLSLFGLNIKISALAHHHWYTWLAALAVGLAIGTLIGAIQGTIIAYVGVPAFIVTLGGMLLWRGDIFRIGGKSGQTLAPTDATFKYLGGAPDRSMGDVKTWVLGGLVCLGIVVTIFMARQRRQRHDLAVRPLGVDLVMAGVGCGVVIAAVALVFNHYTAPSGATAGMAYPVLILLMVTILMTYLAKRRRFGRYVYAYGGNPEAAELGGINTRRTIVGTYALMGALCSISAAIQSARLDSATSGAGVQNELDVIAAAVIGGTSFAGGIGTIPGAVLGAVVMQSLRSGMSLLNIDSPSQDMVVGVVLISAVAVDSLIRMRRRAGMVGALVAGAALAAWIIQTGRP